MTDTNTKPDQLNWVEPKKLPDMLNVLTILTFIGSGLAVLISLYGFVKAPQTYSEMVKMQDKMDQVPAFVKKMMGADPVGAALKALDNRTPLLLLSLVAYGLCIYGAIQMRNYKKIGFSIYVLGELLPLVTSALFLGTASLSGTGVIFSLLLSLVFIILYATQLKNLS
jgi:hypothetical protein